MTDTSIIQTVINVNAPKVDYLQQFVDSHDLDSRPLGSYTPDGVFHPNVEPPPRTPARQPAPRIVEVDELPPVWTVVPDWLEDAPTTTAAQLADALRTALHTIDFADFVERTSVVYLTDATDRIVADHALAIICEANVYRKRISALDLSARTGLSRQACRAAMKRISWILAEIDEPERRPTDTPLYQLSLSNLPRALTDILHDICPPARGDITLHLTAHAGQDALIRSLTAMTPAELAQRNKARDAAGLPRMKRTREMERRLKAQEDAPGRNVMLLIDALLRYGSMTRTELETVMHRSRGAVYRLLVKAHDAGIVEIEDGRAQLVDGWSMRVEELNRITPTAGTTARRKRQAIESKIAYLKSALNDPLRTSAQLERLGDRLEDAKRAAYALVQPEIDAHNARRAAAGLDPVDIEIAFTPGESFWTLKERKNARDLSKELKGLSRDDALYRGALAGYTMQECIQAWEICRGLA